MDCPILDVENYTVFVNGEPELNTACTKDTITVNKVSSGTTILSLFALDTYGLPIFASFQLYFGNITMPVYISFANGSAAPGVVVNLSLADDPRVGQSRVTNESGIATFNNVPLLTISIFAHTEDNQIGLAGLAPTFSQIDLILIPFDDGAKTRQTKNHENLNVTTMGKTMQTISRTFTSKMGANEAYIEYQFVTSEVPGGFFGSLYNDYFSVTLRSAKGHYITKTDSMNGLGLGAFEYTTGATAWSNLTLKVGPTSEKIRFDVGVSNVGDSALDSTVNVRNFGSDVCADCDKDCVKCTSDPMCRDTCTNPAMQSCAFYRDCMEAKVQCGRDGYALGYGLTYCKKFSNSLKSFSTEGKTWIWNTMNCFQKALVPSLKNCEKNCVTLKEIAYDSHPECYVSNGICYLSPLEWISIINAVGNNVFSRDDFIQALKNAPQCIPVILEKIAVTALTQSPANKIALLVFEKWLRSL